MKKIKVLVASALIVSSMAALTGCGNNSKGEELASTDTAVEETTAKVEEEKPDEETTEENKENVEENKEEVKEEVAEKEEVAKAEPAKENKNTTSNNTSTASNNVQNNANQKEPVKQTETQKQPQQTQQPQKKQETPKYRVGEVIPTPDGEVYHTTIHGSAITTTERRLDNDAGRIHTSENAGFHNEYKIYDPSVVKIVNESKQNYKDYYGYDYTEVNLQLRGLKKGKTRVTVSYKNTATGEVMYNTEYYLEIDENLKVYVFSPGNGLEI